MTSQPDRLPKRGEQIIYYPPHRPGQDACYPGRETGFVTGTQDHNAFCRLWQPNQPGVLRTLANSETIPIRHLVRGFSTVPQWIVDWYLKQIEKRRPLQDTKPYRLEVENHFPVHVNHGWREATVLGVIEAEDRAILEYVMPNDSSTLWTVARTLPADPRTGTFPWFAWQKRNISYFGLPRKWLAAICEGSADWWGEPQQQSQCQRIPPEPLKMWREKYGEEYPV